MQRNAPLATDHQLILESLEVFRLIVDRMESDEFVDLADVATVLDFMRDVSCECLDRIHELLLRPALSRAKKTEHVQRLRSAVRRHHCIRPLLDDATAEVSSRRHFVLRAHLLSKVMGDLIREQDHSLLAEAVGLLDDAEGRHCVELFIEGEREISAAAVKRGPALHRLEAKYAYPQCS